MARAVIVGIDGFSPQYMDRFIAEAKLPALCELVRRGVRVPLISTFPATTPVAWASVATGAPPSKNGIEGFLLHSPGERLDQRRSGCYSNRCKSQFLWEAVTLAGKRSYVVKFPLSYPSDKATFRLDGAAGWGGLKCFHEAGSSGVASTHPSAKQNPITAASEVWASEEHRIEKVFYRGLWEIPSLWGRSSTSLHLCVSRSPDGDVRVHIADAPDWSRRLASLSVGEWSEPLTISACGRRSTADCSFRVKILACDDSPPRLLIYNTTLHERVGHASPPSIWEKLLPIAGPIEEQTEPSLVFHAGLDVETQLEIFRLNTEWLSRIGTALIQHENWDLLMIHTHIVDWAHHLLHGALDPDHPRFDPRTARQYELALLRAYRMADDLVDSIVRQVDPDVNVLVLGDHGQDLQHTTFRTNEWLAGQGLLRWADHGEEIDWEHTQAYAAGNYMYLNVEGREPTGIVSPERAVELQQTLIGRLLDFRDARTHFSPVLIAGSKKDFRHLGGDGNGVGDVLFCMRSGYHATNGRGAELSTTVPLREFTSGHDHFWPLDPKLHTRLFAAGPAFRKGTHRTVPAHLTDVAPTVSAVLEIDPPSNSTGAPLRDLLAPERDLPPLVSDEPQRTFATNGD